MKGLTLMAAAACALAAGAVAAPPTPPPAGAAAGADVLHQRIALDARALYGGHEARRVLPRGGALAVDNRSQTRPPTPAGITTDVIDLGGGDVLSGPIDVLSVSVRVDSNAAAEDKLTVQLRSGSTYFQSPGTWSPWSGPKLEPPRGRYVQLRIEAQSRREAFRICGARIDFSCKPRPSFAAGVDLAEQKVQRIITSPIRFGYQRPDHPDLKWLRRTFTLDEVIARARTEFDKVNALCTWVASRTNDRHRGWNKLPYYPWDVRKLITDAKGGTIYGHCASYCVVFIACCNSLGWQARHFGIEGFKRRSHEVAEVYINELGRWVYFDPSLATYYTDRKTHQPLDLVQMHRIYLDTHFNRPGDTVPKLERDIDELNRRRAKINWDAFPARPVSADWVYGKKGKWGWTWGQGIMTTAWLQMTPRNNFLDQPEPIFRNFSDYPTGVNGFPVWTDQRTPPRTAKTHNFFTRRRDFYWTLNQASLRLVRTGERTVAVELGNSQPFFRRYRLRVNGTERVQDSGSFTWRLRPGTNSLEVNCEDAFGRTGVPSSVTLVLQPQDR